MVKMHFEPTGLLKSVGHSVCATIDLSHVQNRVSVGEYIFALNAIWKY